ncbi:protein argonaute-1-like [Cloeon dipterum]|uniref:protein argonaute-1-like n=1 Tax=Cloeon dipterum TaxID=197152 RepID=UPI00322044BD
MPPKKHKGSGKDGKDRRDRDSNRPRNRQSNQSSNVASGMQNLQISAQNRGASTPSRMPPGMLSPGSSAPSSSAWGPEASDASSRSSVASPRTPSSVTSNSSSQSAARSSARSVQSPESTSSAVSSNAERSDKNEPNLYEDFARRIRDTQAAGLGTQKENPPDDGFVTIKPKKEQKQAKPAVEPEIPCEALTNHFKVETTLHKMADMEIIQYDVDMKMKVLNKKNEEKWVNVPRMFKKDVMRTFCESHWPKRYPAYDGNKILYGNQRLLFKESLFSETLRVEGLEHVSSLFKVMVKVTENQELLKTEKILKYIKLDEGVVARSPRTVMQALDVILRQPGMDCFGRTAGRCFFNAEADEIPFRNNIFQIIDICTGWFQAGSLGEPKINFEFPLYLNVDVSLKAFPKADLPVTKTMKELSPKPDLLRNFFRGLQVIYKSPIAENEIYTQITALAETPDKQEFIYENKEISVLNYFKRNKISINVDNKCLKSGSRYYPMEYCTLAPAKYQLPLRNVDKTVTDVMVRISKQMTPKMRKGTVESFFKLLERKSNSDDRLKQEFGLKVDKNMTKVNGTLLKEPTLCYGKEASLKPQNGGVWFISPNSQYFKFMSPIKKITLRIIAINLTKTKKLDLNLVKEKLSDLGKKLGIDNLCIQSGTNYEYKNIPALEQWLGNAAGSTDKRDLDLVIIPDNNSIYKLVKQTFEKKCLLTQCMKEGNAVPKKQYTAEEDRKETFRIKTIYENILMKINAKLGGQNYSLKYNVSKEDTMIMGADVTHPPPGSQQEPSVAAVTASFDQNMTKYSMQWRVQQPKQEIISNLKEITEILVKKYQANAKKLPKHIIFYRDGVSDSQFADVLRKELSAIKDGCMKAGVNEPLITFIVVQKRHHTRFFVETKYTVRGGVETEVNNVKPGFVVDSTITHPWQRDFFLVSHAPVGKTVVRPTRYRILHDDCNMTDKEIEKLTYYLCHLCIRCTRSISYPAPTYYAHLAAARAKHYCKGSNSPVKRNLSEKDLERELERKIYEFNASRNSYVDISTRYPMYFV